MAFQPQVICLFGPTGIGKTRLALELAQRLPCDLISVDSAMVYRGMDIGTAKPSPVVLQQFPHRLIDICEPAYPYSAGNFYQDASREIAASLANQRWPLLVGGTMLYFHVLQQGLAHLPTATPVIREEIINEAQTLGWSAMHAKLAELDPFAAKQIKPTDPQRIQRALEVYAVSGKPISWFWQQSTPGLTIPWINLALLPVDRHLLQQQLAQRFQDMLAAGLVDEVKAFYELPALHLNLPAMRAVGYRQIWQYLAGKIDYETMQTQAIIATRQLAKRQLTWIRRWVNCQYFYSNNPRLVEEVIDYLQPYLDG